MGSSPLTRGAPRVHPGLLLHPGLIPAHAGSTSIVRAVREGDWAHPRSRGEHAFAAARVRTPSGSSPLTRGALRFRLHRWCRRGLIPAHAGSTNLGGLSNVQPRAHPRSRGEHVPASGYRPAWSGSSPLTRGALHGRSPPASGLGLIPAHAGSTSGLTGCSTRKRAHPRSRGEHLGSGPRIAFGWGSSPLTRGALMPKRRRIVTTGLIPAHAGSTKPSRQNPAGLWAHPRSRGEHPPAPSPCRSTPGSSPLTRGARAACHQVWCAGSAHPRSRGEHLMGDLLPRQSGGSSPLTRGARSMVAWSSWSGGLIPAHAGSTNEVRLHGLVALAHPRSRGEHRMVPVP